MCCAARFFFKLISGQRHKAGRALAILIAATIVAAIVAAGARPAHQSGSLLAQALIQLCHGLQGYGIGVCCVASNAKRKEKKEVLVISNNGSKVT